MLHESLSDHQHDLLDKAFSLNRSSSFTRSLSPYQSHYNLWDYLRGDCAMTYLTPSFHRQNIQGAPSTAQNYSGSYDLKTELNSSSVLLFFKAALKTWKNKAAILQVYMVLVTNLQTIYSKQQPSYSKDFHPEEGSTVGENSRHNEPGNCSLNYSHSTTSLQLQHWLHSFWYLLWNCSGIHSLYGNDHEILYDFLHSEKRKAASLLAFSLYS